MSGNGKFQTVDPQLQGLEQKIDALIDTCKALQQENRRLKKRVESSDKQTKASSESTARTASPNDVLLREKLTRIAGKLRVLENSL